MAGKLFAGVARTDITPPVGIAHAGWGAQTHDRAVGVDMPLWATALALSAGEQKVVIVDLDLVWLPEHVVVAVRGALAELAGLPPSHIRLTCSHTHSGPVTIGWGSHLKGGSEMVGPYMDNLTHQVTGVCWAALLDLRPVRLAAGSGTCRIGVNRRFPRPEDGAVIVGRNWDGPVDHEVQVMRIDDMQGQPVAAVLTYACHPLVVGPDNDLITPDYPGAAKRVVEQATGATCLFLQGAGGNVIPTRGMAQGGIHEYRRIGAILGHEASRVWWEMELPPRNERYAGTLESGAPLAIYKDEPASESNLDLRVAVRPMRVPLRELPDPKVLEAELEECTARLEELRAADGDADEVHQVSTRVKRLRILADVARQLQGRTHVTLELQVFTIGDEIALVAVPEEPFVEIGLAVKRDSPFKHTWFSGYSNIGEGNYIPTAKDYEMGGYEPDWGTGLSPGAAQQVVDESLALLRELAG